MIAADLFVPNVLSSAASCPSMVAEDAIVEAAVKFLADTGLWRDAGGPAVVVPTRRDVTVTYNGARIHLITKVTLDGTPLKGVSPLDIIGDAEGTPTGYAVLADKKIRLNKIPSESGLLYFEAILVPSGTDLPDLLVDYRDAVVAGALARLHAQASAPWFNEQLAAERDRQFDEHIRKSKLDVATGFGRADLRVRNRPFV